MSSNKCEGITWTAITQDMLTRYPELAEAGLAIGDKLTIGLAPFDGVVEGQRKPVGECETSCRTSRTKIDGNELGWKSEFVREFFPGELKKIEKNTPIDEINPCYNDPLIEIAADEIMMDGKLDNKARDALGNFMHGKASRADLELVKGRLEAIIAEKPDASPALTLTIKLIDMEMKKAAHKTDIAKPENDRE